MNALERKLGSNYLVSTAVALSLKFHEEINDPQSILHRPIIIVIFEQRRYGTIIRKALRARGITTYAALIRELQHGIRSGYPRDMIKNACRKQFCIGEKTAHLLASHIEEKGLCDYLDIRDED